MADKAQVEAKIAHAIEEAESHPDNGAEEALRYAVESIKQHFDIPCMYEYCGGFDSPGYDIDCYAIAYVTKAGELGIYTYTHETY
ncbi:hypothetical protein MKX34_24030 [Paenibacillus sp. FSL R5-0636]|uniref:hypothetical protein n=1 Tax=Paenibacillus TaxID=44249 RepID=UPI00096C4558|nr:hypothetical protein [Paenibacillus odorifer]OMC96237.1 hypothetical protein BJP49_11085 [Paenibacillus odorifer]